MEKAILICLAMSMLALGCAGCIGKRSSKDKMLDYMDLKYDDHFEYVAPFGGGPGATSKQILVKSEKFPDAQIWVQYSEQDGREIFFDNYNDYRYESLVRERLLSLLQDAFHSDVELAYSVGMKGSANNFNQNTTIEDYLQSKRIGFQAFVLVRDRIDESEMTNNLKRAIEDSGMTVYGSIYFTDDASVFEQAFDLPHKDLNRMEQLQFSMDTLGSFHRLEWISGKMG